LQVDEPDEPRRIGPLVGLDGFRDVDDRPTAARSDKVAGLVRRDPEQPRPDPLGVSKRRQPTPGDGPGGLNGIPGRLGVAADHECHARHRLAMQDHETREGGLVALGSEPDGGCQTRRFLHEQARHER